MPLVLAFCRPNPTRSRPVCRLPVSSTVMLYFVGFSSTTRTTASTLASSWPLRNSTVDCFAGFSFATRKLRAIWWMLGERPGTSEGTLARMLSSSKNLLPSTTTRPIFASRIWNRTSPRSSSCSGSATCTAL